MGNTKLANDFISGDFYITKIRDKILDHYAVKNAPPSVILITENILEQIKVYLTFSVAIAMVDSNEKPIKVNTIPGYKYAGLEVKIVTNMAEDEIRVY